MKAILFFLPFFVYSSLSDAFQQTDVIESTIFSGRTQFQCKFTLVLVHTNRKVNLRKSKVSCSPRRPRGQRANKVKLSGKFGTYLVSLTINPSKIKSAEIEEDSCNLGYSKVCLPGQNQTCPAGLQIFCPTWMDMEKENEAPEGCTCLPTRLVQQAVQADSSPLGCQGGCVCVEEVVGNCGGTVGPTESTKMPTTTMTTTTTSNTESTTTTTASTTTTPENGTWTVIQRRGQYGNAPDYFYSKLWTDYVNGFGNLSGEYWLGLQDMATLTSTGLWELRVDLEDFDGKTYFALYRDFKINIDGPYSLSVSGYDSGQSTLQDSLAYHDGRPFSTSDNDNDSHGGNCAVLAEGAWWYGACHTSNLNGFNYNLQSADYAKGIIWRNENNVNSQGLYFSFPKAEMKVREHN
eukprot:GFUD01008757.1.p1 GENE.GFUD01008757.1~~GFUD01008757.1.p1  ORF type:complete len:406 (+),score=98.72 GFUD01008757.1:100-1317(+)